MKILVFIQVDDNTIGYVGNNGSVVDEAGNIIGTYDFSTNTFTPQDIFATSAFQRIVDSDGNDIGFANEGGQVSDTQGNVLGSFDFDTSTFTPTSLSADAANQSITITNTDGTQTNAILNDDGTVTSADGTVLGTYANGKFTPSNITAQSSQQSIQYVQGGQILTGTLLQNGDVLNAEGQTVGTYDASTGTFTPTGLQAGQTADQTIEFPMDGKIQTGILSANGQVTDADGNVLGTYENGEFTPSNLTANTSGPQAVYDADSNLLGFISSGNNVTDADGNLIGSYDRDNQTFTPSSVTSDSTAATSVTVNYNGENVTGTLDGNNVVVDGSVIGTYDNGVFTPTGVEAGETGAQSITVTLPDGTTATGTLDGNNVVVDGNTIGTYANGTFTPNEQTANATAQPITITMSDGSTVTGTVQGNSVLDAEGNEIGTLNDAGEFIPTGMTAEEIERMDTGYYVEDGILYDDDGTLVGYEETYKSDAEEIEEILSDDFVESTALTREDIRQIIQEFMGPSSYKPLSRFGADTPMATDTIRSRRPPAVQGLTQRRLVKDRDTGEMRYIEVPISNMTLTDPFRAQRRQGFGDIITF